MSVPSYTTDLITIANCDSTTGWTEPTGAIAGGVPVLEADYFIQGTNCVSKSFNASGIGGAIYTNATGIVIPDDGAYLAWIYYAAPNAISTEALGGMRLLVGSSTAAYKSWYLKGSDSYAYGGWTNEAVNPSLTADATYGSPTTTLLCFGYAINSINAVFRGNPFGIDAIRYGRCEARIAGGDATNGYASFTGFAAVNDSVSNRWGLIQSVDGGFLWKGLITLGYGEAVNFVSTNVQILVANTKKVTAAFNKIEVRNAASNISLDGVSFLALGTVSKGSWENIDDATVYLASCTFTKLNTFIFKSLTTSQAVTYRQCGVVTQGNSQLLDCIFDRPANYTAIISDNPEKVVGCEFTSSGTGHAIEATTPGTYTFSGNIFSGYASQDGSTGNEAFYNNSGGLITLNISNSGSNPSVRNGINSTTIVQNTKTLTLTGLVDGTEVIILEAGTTNELYNLEEKQTGIDPQYSYVATQAVDIAVHHVAYEYKRIRNYMLSNYDATLPIEQTYDRTYKNP